jgi:hypothetical protein
MLRKPIKAGEVAENPQDFFRAAAARWGRQECIAISMTESHGPKECDFAGSERVRVGTVPWGMNFFPAIAGKICA